MRLPYLTRDHRNNSIILSLYLMFIFISHILIQNAIANISYFTFIVELSAFSIIIIVTPFILKYISNIEISNSKVNTKFLDKTIKILFYLIPFFIFFIYYIAYYPCGLSADSIRQYHQAITNQYSDWHPVLQTLFSFKLPLLCTGNWVGSIILFQIIVFSIILGYLFKTIYKYTNIKFTAIFIFLIMCNPLTQVMVMYPLKDVVFAMGTILLMIYALHIYMTKGIWLKNSSHMVLFIVLCAFTTICRHNALLFTFPLLIAIAFQISLKRSVIVVVSVLALVFFIRGPIYSFMKVEQAKLRQVETLGLPMSVICAAVTYAPDKLDAEVLEFAYKVAPKEVWKEKGQYGSYNFVKCEDKNDVYIIEKYGTFRVLKLMLKCFKSVPQICIQNCLILTESVYTIVDKYPINLKIGIFKKEFPVSEHLNKMVTTENKVSKYLRNILDNYRNTIYNSVPLLLQYGLLHLIIIMSILAKNSFTKFNDWKRIFFSFPFFAYNYGTSLFLTGNNDSSRYFFYTIFITPILLVLFYCKREKEK